MKYTWWDRVCGILSRRSVAEVVYLRWERKRDQEYRDKGIAHKPADERSNWFATWGVDLDGFRDAHLRTRTDYWLRQARKRHIPPPPQGRNELGIDYWSHSNFYPRRHLLSDAGVVYIRTAVRQEDLLRSELLFRRLTIFLLAATTSMSVFQILSR